MSHPNVKHWHQAKLILCYIKGILDKGLMFNKYIPYTPTAWQDSSFDNGPDGKSQTGFVVITCGAAVTGL
jgi:hypothetical protein